MRTVARVDGNQAIIVKGLRQIGASVLYTHQLKNCFDLLIGYRGQTYIFELKDPAQPLSARKLTPGEQEFKDTWRGGTYHIIETLAQAIAVLTAAPKLPKPSPPAYAPQSPGLSPTRLPSAPTPRTSGPAQGPALRGPGLLPQSCAHCLRPLPQLQEPEPA